MAPRRRGESRFRRLVGPFALFALSANVAYQVSRGLWRAVPRPGVARADGLMAAGVGGLGAHGGAPLLLSKSLLKALGSVIDTQNDSSR